MTKTQKLADSVDHVRLGLAAGPARIIPASVRFDICACRGTRSVERLANAFTHLVPRRARRILTSHQSVQTDSQKN
jgi:hypothetical protein